MAAPAGMREERDSLGAVAVPADALYGVHTVRAVENFGRRGPRLGSRPELVRALALVKLAAARANAELGELDRDVAGAIVTAAREVADGRWPDEFPIALVHGGGGTPANMNVNEVLANRAAELLGGARGTYDRVHPNDHVNRSQSTNDAYPTAVQIAVALAAAETVGALRQVAGTLRAKADAVGPLVRLARTCLKDALPVPAGAAHGGQADAVERTAAALAGAAEALLDVPIGATAVGTGLGAPEGYADRAVAILAEETGMSLRRVQNPLAALPFLDGLVALSGALVRANLVLAQLAADLRFLASNAVAEVRLPAVQVGSSQMPGKLNPVIPELVLQTAHDVRGAAATVEAAAAAGELELNVMWPVAARRLLEALEATTETATLFADRCLAGLEWDERAVERNLAGSLAEAVERARSVGYDTA